MKNITIYKEPGYYCSFPHVVQMENGKLVLAFRKASQFSANAAKNGRATHHDPNSSIQTIYSEDNGQTWGGVTEAYNSEYGVNDPAITLLKDGSLLMRFVALKIVPRDRASELDASKLFSHRSEHNLITQVEGNMLIRSTNAGQSWDVMGIAKGPNEEMTRSCSRDPIIQLEDESLLMSVYTGAPQRSDIAWVMRSFDLGKTWREPIPIMIDPEGEYSQFHGINYNETSLLDLGNNEIYALTRGDQSFHTGDEFMPVGGLGKLYSARSLDGGLCWTKQQDTGIFGQPGAVMKLSNGNLLATYGYRKSPFGIRCCISKNRGLSWDIENEIVIREDAPTWDVGYPFTIEMKNGKLLTVYYFVDENKDRHIAGTIWEI